MTRRESTSKPRSQTALTKRSTRTVVFPVPAPAETKTAPPASIAAACSGLGARVSSTLMGRPPAHEGVEGLWGNREVPPLHRRRGPGGETWFPPRERAEGERRSRVGLSEASDRHGRLTRHIGARSHQGGQPASPSGSWRTSPLRIRETKSRARSAARSICAQ